MKYVWIVLFSCVCQMALAEGRTITLDEAVRQVQSNTGGKVVSAQTKREGGREVHEIKIITPQGEVQKIIINAQSGG